MPTTENFIPGSNDQYRYEVKTTETRRYGNNRSEAFIVQASVSENLDYEDDYKPQPAHVLFDFVSQSNGRAKLDSNQNVISTGSIEPGMVIYQGKTGDGSAHCITLNGTVGGTGKYRYSEIGGFQGVLQNLGADRALLEGLGLQLKDNGRRTAMTGAILNLYKDSSHTDNGNAGDTVGLQLNSLGAYAANAAVFAVGKWRDGINLSAANITDHAMIVPQDAKLAWSTSAGITYLRTNVNGMIQAVAGNSPNSGFQVRHSNQAVRFQVATAANDDPVYVMVGGVLKQVTQGDPGTAGSAWRVLRVPN